MKGCGQDYSGASEALVLGTKFKGGAPNLSNQDGFFKTVLLFEIIFKIKIDAKKM